MYMKQQQNKLADRGGIRRSDEGFWRCQHLPPPSSLADNENGQARGATDFAAMFCAAQCGALAGFVVFDISGPSLKIGTFCKCRSTGEHGAVPILAALPKGAIRTMPPIKRGAVCQHLIVGKVEIVSDIGHGIT